jgi:hypothetical protein
VFVLDAGPGSSRASRRIEPLSGEVASLISVTRRSSRPSLLHSASCGGTATPPRRAQHQSTRRGRHAAARREGAVPKRRARAAARTGVRLILVIVLALERSVQPSGGADALDPDHRRRHCQQHRPLVGAIAISAADASRIITQGHRSAAGCPQTTSHLSGVGCRYGAMKFDLS